jgi:proteasome lid subunit RPN8/RPN11
MTTQKVLIAGAAAETIARHGAEAYPHECCGALVERGGEVVEAWPLDNTTGEGPRRRFLVSPKDYLAAEARAAQIGGTLAGFYHSHPDHPARPSQYDLDHAWPNLWYVIVSVNDGAAGAMTCWRLSDDRASFEQKDLTWPLAS